MNTIEFSKGGVESAVEFATYLADTMEDTARAIIARHKGGHDTRAAVIHETVQHAWTAFLKRDAELKVLIEPLFTQIMKERLQ